MPHHVHESTCYVNGLFDVLAWQGATYDYSLLPVVGGMANFAYLKFKRASPPCMVYWGTNPKYFLRNLGEIIGFNETISEGKSFDREFPKIKAYLENDEPVVAGALDMYYLPYYAALYHKQHIPIHYILLVGYDDDRKIIYVHDCSFTEIQEVSYEELEKALDVSVPGMSRKNTYRVFNFLDNLPRELGVAEKGFLFKARQMLNPPVSMFGIPGMRKLAKEIVTWDNPACFRHMVAFAGLHPPLVDEDLSFNDGFRREQARVVRLMGEKYSRISWLESSHLFEESAILIIELCRKAINMDGMASSDLLNRIADIEEKAYQKLS